MNATDTATTIATESHEWVSWPKFTASLPTDGKVTGTVSVTFTDGSRAVVNTEAHHNDDLPAVTFRNREWLVHVAYSRQADETWAVADEYNSVTERGLQFGNDAAPKTFRAAIIAALTPIVAELATEDTIARADYAAAMQSLNRLDRELAEARAKVNELVEARYPHLTVVDNYRNR